ncbi:MAG: endopeptidase La [Chloroflexota bacterium]
MTDESVRKESTIEIKSEPKAKEEALEEPQQQIPEELAILPLRGTVVFPLTAVPLNVGQERSIRLVDDVVSAGRIIGLVASRDADIAEPGPDEIYTFGTAAAVHRMLRAPDGTIRLLVQGLERIQVTEWLGEEPYLKAKVEVVPELTEDTLEVEALVRNVLDQFRRMTELVPSIPGELLTAALSTDDPKQLVYAITTYIRTEVEDAQDILELDSVTDKLRKLVGILVTELEVLELGRKIQNEAQSEMEQMQREYFLREQMKAIQRQLGEQDEQAVEVAEFTRKIDESGMPEEAEKEARRELDRLSKLPSAAAEYGVIRTYLDWLTSLPWKVSTEDKLEIDHAHQVLDEDHYGLEDIKDRILEYLAVRKLRADRKAESDSEDTDQVDAIRREREGVILCFVGPPGVGKTSLGQSIARATGRKFIRQSLGGISDEAEIRGHRRTYIGALPGRVVQAIRRVGSNNPVFMLDEVDKLGRDYRGDPSSALLEVLDPEQNREFRDHYLDVPFDLSQVMFITTANLLEPIPGPLRDRMEILQLSGYTDMEKVQIAQGYLVPRQIRENGLRTEEIEFTDDALYRMVQDYTREAGVRNLERTIGSVCRKVAVKVAAGEIESTKVDEEQVQEYLGPRKFFEEVARRTQVPGVATGLAWTQTGGSILFVEASQMPGSKGFTLTGQLGDVMQESAQAALTVIRSKSDKWGIAEDHFANHDIHIHVPAGSTPKDGPSAGVTIATALASLITGRSVRSDVGMTGEITLRGQVMPIGGVKEKVLAAHRAGLKEVILPKRNENDLEKVPDDVREAITFTFTDSIDELIDLALCSDGDSDEECIDS